MRNPTPINTTTLTQKIKMETRDLYRLLEEPIPQLILMIIILRQVG